MSPLRSSDAAGKQRVNPTKKVILDRIERLEEAITKANEYIENGTHAHWTGFQPLFAPKFRDGERLPPHKDWVRNVLIPQLERALARAERALDRLDP